MSCSLPKYAVTFEEIVSLMETVGRGLTGRPINVCKVSNYPLPRSLFVVLKATDSIDSISLPESVCIFQRKTENASVYRTLLLLQLCTKCLDDPIEDLYRNLAVKASSPLLRRVFGILETIRAIYQLRRFYPGASAAAAKMLYWEGGHRGGTSLPTALNGNLEQLLLDVLRQRPSSPPSLGSPALTLCFAQFLVRCQAAPMRWRESWELAFNTGMGTVRRGCQSLQLETELNIDEALRGNMFALETGKSNDLVPMHHTGALPLTRGRTAATVSAEAAISSVPTHLVDSWSWPALAVPRGEGSGLKVQPYFTYDEWDSELKMLKRSWCKVIEISMKSADATNLSIAQLKSKPLLHRLRSHIVNATDGLRLDHRQYSSGDDIDLDALVESVADWRAGNRSMDFLFRQRRLPRRDVAAVLLLDVSASTDFPLPVAGSSGFPLTTVEDDPYLYGGTPAITVVSGTLPAHRPRRIIDAGREAASFLAELADSVGDRFAILAYSSNGRERVEISRVKDFSESFGITTLKKLSGLVPSGGTRTAAAIRHASAVLEEQDAKTKVLILITDGYPEDSDYGGRTTGVKYAVADAAYALGAAECTGIKTFCIAIDNAGSDYLKLMCKPESYRATHDLSKLSEQVGLIYQQLTCR